MTSLDVRSLRLRYPGREQDVLAGVDLRAGEGELIFVLGRNGSGKSTLLRAIAGLLAPSSGSVRIGGREGSDFPAADRVRRIGFVGETGTDGFLGGTVAEELAFPLENLGVPRASMVERVGSVLERLGIADLSNRSVRELSVGERQLVSLAVALSADPPVLLLDEPTLFLDGDRAHAFWLRIEELTREGKTAVAVGCRPSEDIRPDRTLLLRGGRLVPLEDSAWADEVLEPADRTSETFPLGDPTGPSGFPTFEMESVDFAYRQGVTVLSDVCLSIKAGESILIGGPMGGGKTTLCRLLLGIERPSGGTVRFEGSPLGSVRREVLHRVGYVSQSPEVAFYTSSVAEEPGFGLEFLGRDVVSLRGPLLRALNLESLDARHPQTLSRGERKRLSICCALAKGPDFLVLDDVFAGLDPVESRRVSELLDRTRASGRGFLLTGEVPPGSRPVLDRRGEVRRGRVSVD